ncbi:MAG: DUF5681 domain-containing protein [Phenylobacterium sp.]|uniref:DUF5681 domain-containing protein n=1 Tax=Phenylobacterium sp. TaxID=1871053 RepID=UPI003BB5A16F
MTDKSERPGSYEVGYGKPPKASQFKERVSGNPKGRPRKPKRMFAPRQVRRDILSVTESPTILQTADGELEVPTVVAVLLVARKKALQGHGPSIKLILDHHNAAIADHWDLENMDARTLPTLEGEVRYFEREMDKDAIEKALKRKRRRRRSG